MDGALSRLAEAVCDRLLEIRLRAERRPQLTPKDESSAALTYETVEFDTYTGPKPALYFLDYVMGVAAEQEAQGHLGFKSSLGSEGFWVVTDGALIEEAHKRPDLFSSSSVVPLDPDPTEMLIPEMIDPPDHTKWRRILAPAFAPSRMKAMEPKIRALARQLIEGIAIKGHVDFVGEFGRVFPATIFLEFMGLPQEDLEMFNSWETAILHSPYQEGGEGAKAMYEAQRQVKEYFRELIATRRAEPKEDLVTLVLQAQGVDEDDLLSVCALLFQAGLDTVGAQLAYAMLHLATHDNDRRRLVAEPEITPLAVEELLRAYPIILNGRKLTRDAEFAGCPMKTGDTVLLPIVLANRKHDEFNRGDEVVLDRSPNRHFSFGVGPHRCLGAHLARIEMNAALEEWHRIIPEYHVEADHQPVEHGSMLGLDVLKLTWDSSV
jgi:cytochrome P450